MVAVFLSFSPMPLFHFCLPQVSFSMLMGANGQNNGVNYDPMNPMGQHSWRKDAKAANRIAGLVTKFRNQAMFTPHPW